MHEKTVFGTILSTFLHFLSLSMFGGEWGKVNVSEDTMLVEHAGRF